MFIRANTAANVLRELEGKRLSLHSIPPNGVALAQELPVYFVTLRQGAEQLKEWGRSGQP